MMKFYINLIKIQLKIKTLVLILSLLSDVLGTDSILLLTSCKKYRQSRNSPECHQTSQCNLHLKLCVCKPGYPIPLIGVGICVEYRKLGQDCFITQQCTQTENSICVTPDGKQIDSVAVNFYQRYNNNNNNLYSNIKSKKETVVGQCKCKKGYKQISGNRCHRASVNNLNCSGAFQCLDHDLNSHCDKSGRCLCDPGFVFDDDKNACALFIKKLGDICREDFDCQNWDQNMVCSNRLCVCNSRYIFDSDIQRCKLPENVINTPPTDSKYQLCKFGFTWDEQSGECEREGWRYGLRGEGEYRLFSVDKLLETIVIVIFCCVTIAFLRFWRYILPQNITESQTGMFSDFSHTNRVQRRRTSRSNSLSRRGRVIQLRVNLESPEPQDLSEETYVVLPLTASHSSLPTYESASSTTAPIIANNPPPYSDEPPTYEEAINLYKTPKL